VSSVLAHLSAVDPLGVLARFRQGFHASLYAREDALFELTDALLCTSGPIRTLVELCLAAAHRRGHGGMYAALNEGDLGVPTVFDTPHGYAAVVMRSCQARRVSVGVR
jgi:hypothetical protein